MLWQHGDLDAAQQAFKKQVRSRFQELWAELTAPEQLTLKQLKDPTLPVSSTAVKTDLQLHGLLKEHGQSCSESWAAFVGEQP
ncbi:MAG: hypothetical protein ACFB0C_13150 [Leptolyngbyaceae cyanobacterium]